MGTLPFSSRDKLYNNIDVRMSYVYMCCLPRIRTYSIENLSCLDHMFSPLGALSPMVIKNLVSFSLLDLLPQLTTVQKFAIIAKSSLHYRKKLLTTNPQSAHTQHTSVCSHTQHTSVCSHTQHTSVCSHTQHTSVVIHNTRLSVVIHSTRL